MALVIENKLPMEIGIAVYYQYRIVSHLFEADTLYK